MSNPKTFMGTVAKASSESPRSPQSGTQAASAQPIISTIIWHRPEEEMPRSEDPVLILVAPVMRNRNVCWPARQGFYEAAGETWFWEPGKRIYGTVLLWADLPQPPEGV